MSQISSVFSIELRGITIIGAMLGDFESTNFVERRRVDATAASPVGNS